MTHTYRLSWRHPLAALFLAAGVLLAAACGGSSAETGTDEQQIKRLVETFFEATFKDPKKAYGLLDSASRSQCSEKDFVQNANVAAAFFKMLGGGSFKVHDVSDVRVNGDTATAMVDIRFGGDPSSGGPEQARFTREGGKWKIADGCL